MNTRTTRKYMKQHGMVGLTADFSDQSPEIEQLLKGLGRYGNVLPYYALYPGDGRPPITFDGILTQGILLDKLKQAVPTSTLSVSQNSPPNAVTN
ncbi:MAG: hypothetical protein WBF93_02020 [Pirellulales bacterium]|nr:hypothetical protein [Pirellulales bacterium]